MSIEPGDLLEEALRGDLPTPDAEARVRRRLLAAGVAIGNGVATTTAAGASAGAASVAVKTAGLSWGLKVGLAALVGIPTVGLWLDGRAPQPARSPVSTHARPLEAKPQPASAAATPPAPRQTTDPVAPAAAERAHPRAVKTLANDATTPVAATPPPAPPSQAEFAASEQQARTPQVQSTLAEETRLLDAAFAALTAGDRARAASLLQQHEGRFPSGLLQKERERAKTKLTEMARGE
jgi:hypothetical protein